MSDLIVGILGIGLIAVVSIIVLFGLIKLEIWVYNDANRRRMRGGIWAFFVFITLFIPGLLVYLVIRKPAGSFKYHRF